jgi:UDP-N-acetylmuramoyl-tripeptide--D-alanyl-D-alanine ligase
VCCAVSAMGVRRKELPGARMELSLGQVQQAIQAQLHSDDLDMDRRAHGWSIDSRTVAPGDVFFAIRGEQFDGHAFTRAALERGALAAVVSEPIEAGPLLHVADTLRALTQLAYWARRHWDRPVVAVTGSAGKTSTKDIVAELLGVRLRVGKTTGNLNNHLGLPLTLLRLPDDAEVAVVELGMNHAGEIRQLAALAAPQYGLVTNVGYAHVENFNSLESVAAAKRELIESLPPTGVAILNADDELVRRFSEAHAGLTLTYGFTPASDIRATNVEIHGEGGSSFTVNGICFRSRLAGRHSISNILAGLAVAHLFAIPFDELVEAVERLRPGRMRGERSHWRGVTILNDSYNSNPEAARHMIDVLRGEKATRRIAVLGEMLELGHMSEELHRQLGSYAAGAGVDVLVGVSGAASFLIDEAKKAGLSECNVFFFEDAGTAGTFLRDMVRPGDAILFKASRGTQVERALVRMEE